jgi:cytochrome c
MCLRILAFFLFSMLLLGGCSQIGPQPAVLVFSKTSGYRHASIEAGIDAIQKLGEEHGFKVEATEDSAFITEENLKKFAAVIFLNTSGDVLNNWQQADFQRFIEAGGGFVGVHGASATEYDWRWYGKLVGAFFDQHPEIQEARVKVVDRKHPATEHLPDIWQRTDEWYNFRPVPPADKVLVEVPKPLGQPAEKDSLSRIVNNVVPSTAWTYDNSQPFLSPDVKILLSLDETSYKGGTHGVSHPVSWYQAYEGGRSFYTAMGHTIESYKDENYLKHLLGGIQYAIGEGKPDYSKTKTHRIPPEDRFVRTVLASNLNEPTEMAIFPNGQIIFVERKGAIKIYDPLADTVETVCYFPVYHENEEGLMGVQIDPNWEKNKWIYLFYSVYEGPKQPVYVANGSYHQGRYNRLSRFVFDNKMLHLSTEKVLLTVPELIGCCHTGGSIDFDSKGNLFLSTGDNTNPFESDGFGPFDERPGRALWDAQKSSANTNDLRGKILRITPQADGTYTIPQGNLFPAGTTGTRPEIFVMGCRNPYRIAVDKKTDCLYWGDVGPDAGKDGPQRGSKGYDFWGRACEAGFYGWPQFRGNHRYYDYNFATKKSGPLFDPEHPVNDSPNNTGLRELPPVKQPLIWYSYDESYEFPWLGTGGKNPMAGPVFHADAFPRQTQNNRQPATIFPDYFENKFIMYEWMRHWIYVITLDEQGKYVQADPFMPGEKFSRPMDMAFGPDGALYVLEYGEVWFAQNPDARLNKIEYAPGNRKPVARITAEPMAGGVPLKVRLSATESTDYDKDTLRYEWILENEAVRSHNAVFEHTFTKVGIFPVELRVTDAKGAMSRARIEVNAGNTPPVVSWKLGGNQTFYFDDSEIAYRLDVNDPEDGSLAKGNLDPRRVNISIDYLAEGKDIAAIAMGHQTKESAMGNLKFAGGQLLTQKSDCKTCHNLDRKINGPSFYEIANRYYGNKSALNLLSEKVIKGGAGNWGETAMSAHPNLTKSESEQIVQWILSLAGEAPGESAIPFEGKYTPKEHLGKAEKGAYIFTASYRDKGNDGSGSLYARETLVLRNPKIEAENFDKAAKGIRRSRSNAAGELYVTDIFHGRYFGFEKIDLTGIGSILIGLSGEEGTPPASQIEVLLDSPNGKVIGQAAFTKGIKEVKINPELTAGRHDIYFVFKNEKQPDIEIVQVNWVQFERQIR